MAPLLGWVRRSLAGGPVGRVNGSRARHSLAGSPFNQASDFRNALAQIASFCQFLLIDVRRVGPRGCAGAESSPPLTTIIWLMNIAAKMVSMVTSFPLETDAPVAKAPPTLLRIFRSRNRPNFDQLSKKVFTSPDILPKYTGEPTMTASADT